MLPRLTRGQLREHVLEFASDPRGVFFGDEDDFMRRWDAGERFDRSFVALRGLIVRVAMDEGFYPGEEMDRLLDEVFLPV